MARLVKLGPLVVGVSRREPTVSFDPGRFTYCRADIASEAGRKRVADVVRHSGLPIKYVVVASGVAHRALISDDSQDDWRHVLDTNLIGPALLLGELLELEWMVPSSIVLIGSLSARRALPRRSLYGASKAALEQFGRVAAVELAGRGIRVNVASVGVTDTPFLAGDRETLDRYISERIPIGRAGRPDEVADLVEYLVAGPMFMTGATIEIDGGSGVNG